MGAMRRWLPVLLVGAVCLLVVGIGLGVAGHGNAITRAQEALSHRAIEHAGRLDDYFARSRSNILLTAQNPAFRDFYAGTGTRERRLRAARPWTG